jgi:putative peptidoglycan lipid II flippase
MAIGTIASRITGLIRGLLAVALLGTALLGDVFNVANTMPNILYNLIVGGALTAVFVPQLVRSMREADGGSAFISKLTTATLTILGAITLLAIIAAPLLVRIFASSYVGRPEFGLTVLMMRFCLPQVFFIAIYALFSQIANAKGNFGPMMWAPVANNLIGIATFAFFLLRAPHWSVHTISHADAIWLTSGTTIGYVVQAAVLIPVIWRAHLKFKLDFHWRDPEIAKSKHLAIWTILFAAISQVSYLITVNLSSSAAIHAEHLGIKTGVGFTPYSNAYFVMLLPHSVITISLVTALLPQLSILVLEGKRGQIHDQLVRAIRLVGIFTIPSSLAFLLFGPVITRSLFFGISQSDASYIGYVLAAFSFGLAPMSLNLIGLRALNAYENVKLQVWSNLFMNMVAVLISFAAYFVLPAKWVTVGLAGALSASYFIGAWITFRLLHRYGIVLKLGEVVGFYLKLALIFTLVGLPLFLALPHLPGGNMVHLILVLAIGGLGYLGLAKAFKVREVSSAFALLVGGKK